MHQWQKFCELIQINKVVFCTQGGAQTVRKHTKEMHNIQVIDGSSVVEHSPHHREVKVLRSVETIRNENEKFIHFCHRKSGMFLFLQFTGAENAFV
jgi:hypothetical protein